MFIKSEKGERVAVVSLSMSTGSCQRLGDRFRVFNNIDRLCYLEAVMDIKSSMFYHINIYTYTY